MPSAFGFLNVLPPVDSISQEHRFVEFQCGRLTKRWAVEGCRTAYPTSSRDHSRTEVEHATPIFVSLRSPAILSYPTRQPRTIYLSSIRKRLGKLAVELEENPKAGMATSPRIKAGTKIIREWQGQHHEVIVVANGFDYRGNRYASLSEIAREITGTGWSGPLFFGLKSSRKARMNQ
jgi:Protein of unknown function (DUF2924)